MTAAPSYLIVGAGIFGVSTAYHLLKQHPRASITLVDRDAHDAERRVAASWDWNKVMRADYDDPTYCALALEAQDVFTGGCDDDDDDDDDEGLWRPHFHQTGLYWMCGREYAQRCVANVRRLGRAADADAMAMCTVDEARALFGGLFRDADYTHVETVLVNPSSGWVAAGECLGAVTRHVLRRGVRYVAEEVATLLFGDDDDGDRARCVGVETAAGRRCLADHVILCTGAFTPKLLELSAARHDPGLAARLVAGDRILAGGITTGMTRLAGDAAVARFANMPVGIQGYTAAKGPFVGSLPPTRDNELKWWGQKIFRNTTEVLPGRFISTPPPDADYAQWAVSDRLKEDILAVSSVFYGPHVTRNWTFEKHRVCWDAFTTSSDFIISPHAAAEGLYVATCGSFHGFKFFPIIGKYVVQMLEGTLSRELADKWAWDRERPDPAANPDWPSVEMRELLDGARTSRL